MQLQATTFCVPFRTYHRMSVSNIMQGSSLSVSEGLFFWAMYVAFLSKGVTLILRITV